LQLSQNATRVLEARYLRSNDRGETVETPAELFHRVARAVSEAELLYGSSSKAGRWEERFYEMLSSLDFLPNSPTLMDAGTRLSQLSGSAETKHVGIRYCFEERRNIAGRRV
jgi:ribonucleoside-diphosphate reductase alpha chain